MSDPSTEFVSSTSMLADDILLVKAAEWQNSGHGLAVAFVIETWGSSPRQIGSIMLIRDDMEIAGSVSGGCVEGIVIDTAMGLILSGDSKCLNFSVANESAWEVGLSCGGEITILVMAVSSKSFPPQLLTSVAKSIERREPISLYLPISGARAREAENISKTSSLHGEEFCFVQTARPQLIIIGAVHISQHLSEIAAQIGFRVVVIDPRTTFATRTRFPNTELVFDWPDIALPKMALDSETAFVALTHDPKIDDVALHKVLREPLFYTACLGSRRTHSARLDRLASAGFDTNVISKIRGPAGLDIGAKTPAEIAVSISAELIAAYRAKDLK